MVYDKEGVDPGECQAVYCTAAHHRECVPVTSFRTGINDDEYGLHQDYEKWLEELAPHAPISQYRHNDTGEDNADAHMKRQIMGPRGGGRSDQRPAGLSHLGADLLR